MADTYETKKINELNEVTSADDSDLMMVGNPNTGETDKITKENFLKEINEDLSKSDIITRNGTAINSGDDLNNYMTPGKYYSASGTITQTLSNTPDDLSVGFSLYVFYQANSTSQVVQFLTGNGQGVTAYIRYFNGNQAWKKFVYTDDLTSINTSLTELESDVTEINSALSENMIKVAYFSQSISSLDGNSGTILYFDISELNANEILAASSYARGSQPLICNINSNIPYDTNTIQVFAYNAMSSTVTGRPVMLNVFYR